jgi:hypothetical protein
MATGDGSADVVWLSAVWKFCIDLLFAINVHSTRHHFDTAATSADIRKQYRQLRWGGSWYDMSGVRKSMVLLTVGKGLQQTTKSDGEPNSG